MKNRLACLIFFILISFVGFCNPVIPSDPISGRFSDGIILTSDQLNAWFLTLYTWANGGITDANIASSASIAYNKISIPQTYSTSFVSLGTTCTSPVFLTSGKVIIYFDGMFQMPVLDYTVSDYTITSTYLVASGTKVQIVKLD